MVGLRWNGAYGGGGNWGSLGDLVFCLSCFLVEGVASKIHFTSYGVIVIANAPSNRSSIVPLSYSRASKMPESPSAVNVRL